MRASAASAVCLALLVSGGCGWMSAGPAAPPRPRGVSSVTYAAAKGELTGLLAGERSAARKDGRCAVAQVYADWCGPCRALRASMDDPRMQDAFAGVHLVQLELDAWDPQLRAQKPEINLPSLYEIREDGTLGQHIDGGAWGSDVPENMAPPLGAFVNQACGW